MKLINIPKHFILITRHRLLVFKLCCKIGIPWRGLVHDLSKYSPTEFFEGVKYYTGTCSPISQCKKDKGYSKAWLHHKGRNKHHVQYWTDESLLEKNIVIPYKYAAEMVCDKMAAGMIYNGKNFNNSTELGYYLKERRLSKINDKIDKYLLEVFEEVSKNGVNETLTKENIKRIYNKNILVTDEKNKKCKKEGDVIVQSNM